MFYYYVLVITDSRATRFISLCAVSVRSKCFLFIGFLFDSSFLDAFVCLCYICSLHEFHCIFSFESNRILSYVRNPIFVLSNSVCCTVEISVPNQYQQSSLRCLDLHANKVSIRKKTNSADNSVVLAAETPIC